MPRVTKTIRTRQDVDIDLDLDDFDIGDILQNLSDRLQELTTSERNHLIDIATRIGYVRKARGEKISLEDELKKELFRDVSRNCTIIQLEDIFRKAGVA